MAGVLYVCGTPIGNLEDLSSRAARILAEVDLVAAEDTRHTRKLLSHLGISVRLTSYHEHNKVQKGSELVERLTEGASIALVSDAGMPGISDPGSELIAAALAAGIAIIPVPGPTALVTGLVISGLPSDRFYYGGFLPRTNKDIRHCLLPLAALNATLVFYESPHRIAKSLKVVLEVLGDRRAALCRELTKMFEECIRGRISEIALRLDETPARGELTLVVGPPEGEGQDSDGEGNRAAAAASLSQSVRDFVAEMLASGLSERDSVRAAVARFGIPKKEAYRTALEAKREREPGSPEGGPNG